MYLHSHSPPPRATVIGIPTYNTPDVYTVAFKDGSICEYTSDMLSAVPDKVMSTSSTLLPSWIKWGANATLFLTHMAKPRHGTLNISDDNLMFYLLENPRRVYYYLILGLIVKLCWIQVNYLKDMLKLRASMMLGIRQVY